MYNLTLLLISTFLVLSGCTDAEITKFTTLGQRAEIVCKSGGSISFHGISTGKVLNERNSDGYYAKWKIIAAPDFKHAKPGNIMPATLSSDCNIIYIED